MTLKAHVSAGQRDVPLVTGQRQRREQKINRPDFILCIVITPVRYG
jgi:hypothetical protein